MSRKEKSKALTKRKLMDAFWSLYKDRGIENISIKEVTDLAGYQRSTFYRYFQNLREVLLAVEDELLQEHNPQFMGMVFDKETHDDEQAIRYYEEYFERYGEYFKVLLGPHGDPGFMAKFMDFSMEQTEGEVGVYGHVEANKPVIARALRVFVFHGAMAVLAFWVDHREEMTADEMRELLFNCYTGGVKIAEMK